MGIDVTNIDPLANPEFAGANNSPNPPSVQVPMAPPQQQAPPTAPDIENAPVNAIAASWLKNLTANQPAPLPGTQAHAEQTPPQARPGSFASQLVKAAGAIGVGLGDAAGADAPGASGWLSGVSRTLQTRDQRLTAESQRKFENDQAQKRNDQLNAMTAVQTLAAYRNLHNQDVEQRNASNARGKTFVDSMRANHDVEEGITQDELSKRVGENPSDFANKFYVRQVSDEPVLDGDGKPKMDKDGNPVTSPIYTLVSHASRDGRPDSHEVSPEESSYFTKHLGQDIPAGSKLTVEQYAALSTRALGAANTEDAINKSRLEELNTQQREQLQTLMQDSDVQHAVASVKGNALAGLYAGVKNGDAHIQQTQAAIATAQQKGDTAAVQQLQGQLQNLQSVQGKLTKAINQGFSNADREKFAADEEKARHDAAQEAIANHRADVAAQKETAQKGLGDSYKTENKEFDTIRKPLSTSLDAFSTLRNSLDQGTAAGDSVVAPALLKALVAGGGVRITQAEINNFTHGRSSVEDLKGVLQKMTNGKSITPDQRQQVYALLGAVESKVRMKNDILNDAQDQLDAAQSVADQRSAVSSARRKLDAVDAGHAASSPATKSASANDPFAQFGGKAH